MTLKLKLVVIFSLILIALVFFISPYYIFVTKTLKVSPIKTLLSLDGLKSYNGHVNILFLGIAGVDHEGPNLSDSIVVASYDLKNNYLATISIPRDVWSESLRDKINSAYAYGEAKKKGSGFILAKAEVETIIGQPIHYAAAVNFDQFEELIDFVGGVDVAVERTFDDFAFPIPESASAAPLSCGHSEAEIKTFTDSFPTEEEIWKYFPCRYQHIHFDKGLTHMDGRTALNFVRSRHAQGDEGTDFAREKRQQKTMEAIKNKLISFAKKLNIEEYQKLYELVNKLVKRDIDNQQAAIILKDVVTGKKFTQEKIVLSEDFFTNPTTDLSRFDGRWVLTPINGDIGIVHDYINCKLDKKTNCEGLKPKREEDR
jgi:anionic cell wall polymer biosynthesis LytR-Cps2A-Psr (LCP) family protein